jgi:hypothetical protein
MELHTVLTLVHEPSPFEADVVIAKLKNYECQILIKFQGTRFRQEVIYYVRRSVNSLNPFEKRKNCPSTGSNILVYKFTTRV